MEGLRLLGDQRNETGPWRKTPNHCFPWRTLRYGIGGPGASRSGEAGDARNWVTGRASAQEAPGCSGPSPCSEQQSDCPPCSPTEDQRTPPGRHLEFLMQQTKPGPGGLHFEQVSRWCWTLHDQNHWAIDLLWVWTWAQRDSVSTCRPGDTLTPFSQEGPRMLAARHPLPRREMEILFWGIWSARRKIISSLSVVRTPQGKGPVAPAEFPRCRTGVIWGAFKNMNNRLPTNRVRCSKGGALAFVSSLKLPQGWGQGESHLHRCPVSAPQPHPEARLSASLLSASRRSKCPRKLWHANRRPK